MENLPIVALKWEPVTMPTTAHSVQPPSMEWRNVLTIEMDKLLMPYIAEGFWKALEDSLLIFRYLSLVHNLIHGSPIGVPAPLTHMTFMPNLILAKLQPDL